mmetsp:Transcript_10203/g.7641  ORF Transcript_10203/g.7641 Transcript_10203/m.7641 type:complete len:123 (+) Transcript_10203:184-552(+)
MEDLYATLGLKDRTYNADEGEIKSSYKKLALMYHPDKMGDSITESDKQVWLKIQAAYETLVDPVKRRKYDSTLPFNDDVPSESDDVNDENFYEVFRPVFTRNARFSKKMPVPDLGNNDTPIE